VISKGLKSVENWLNEHGISCRNFFQCDGHFNTELLTHVGEFEFKTFNIDNCCQL